MFFQASKLNLELEVRTDQNLNSNLKMVSLKNFLTIEPLALCFPFEVIIAHLSNDAIRQPSVINVFIVCLKSCF